ncbi:serine carboxypeptidase-like 31 [Carica papaya]|uniref:serine carboxypeptidase-like 31 n=1 Tax=Carica papaya TaxID=3649 RepID=UPI000B8C8574|nr:serine carboxypeptidase-like 31 [Carica papaya]XP_021902173.1 serine carboxypeptidase-like 31 [Carica papaya]XP_021902174.1 serine carboxypeptidase-like 31 [Carica papaya]
MASEDLVTNLPGQPHVEFKHYAGYVTVNEKNGRALFYWFYEATTLPDDKPLVLWLNGGPGCSSVGYGATQEIGPFLVDTDGQGIKINPYSWSTEANMLFLESPVGVGFSYSNTTSDYKNLGDDFTANDSYTFLHKWFLKFPSYRKRTFYIAGESYAGKYVPELAELIYDKNNDPSLYIDLKGILLGNPETSDAEDWRGLVDYAWSHAVVSDETHKIIKENCDFGSDNTWENNNCSEAVDEVLKQYKEIDIYSLYTSVCIGDTANSEDSKTKIMMKRSSKMMPRIMGGYDPCLDEYAETFYNRLDVQKALHVSYGRHLRNWSICNSVIFEEWSYSRPSVLPIYKKLIAAGQRIWVYSGDTDGRVPVLSTRYSLSSLGLPIKMAWRPWYHEKQVSGWFQEYEGLTFATFRGAGHAVPSFKPSSSLAFFSAFLQGVSPPSSRYV